MDKIFNVEIDGQITLPDGRKLGPFEETTVNVVQPSECAPDPILENAKSTGGIGYTEQGEYTVLVDNESITTVADRGMNTGLFATPFDIVDGTYTVIFNGTEYNLNSAFYEMFGLWYLGGMSESGPDFSQYPFNIASDGEGAYLYTEFAGDYEVTVKKSSDTIHKIDEKYLPANQEMIVKINPDGLTNYSVKEIVEAYKSGVDIRGYIYRGVRLLAPAQFVAARTTSGYFEVCFTSYDVISTTSGVGIGELKLVCYYGLGTTDDADDDTWLETSTIIDLSGSSVS